MTSSKKISITIDNKILFHIFALGHFDESEEIPVTLTQSGIAESINTPLGSVSRALKKLIDNGSIIEKLYHVHGKKRRMSAYFLTLKGEKFILELQNKLTTEEIKLKTADGKVTFGSVSHVIKKVGKKASMIDIINHISKYGYYDEVLFAKQLVEKTKPRLDEGYTVKHLGQMPKLRQFFDRQKEMTFLNKNLKTSKIIVVHGMAGIGKSSLAAKFIEQYSKSNNILWYRFQEWDTIRNILMPMAEFLAEMNRKKLKTYIESVQTIDFFEVINILHGDLHMSNSIIVFDDFHRVNKRIIQFFSSLTEHLEKIDNIFILLLSRSLIRFYDRREVSVKKMIKEMHLTGLDREGSRELIKPKIIDKLGFNKIYELTEGHPLALELIETSEDLSYPTKDIMKFVHEEIFSRLEQDEKDLLKAISVYRRPVNSDCIFIEDSLDYDTLDKLIEKALVNEVEPRIYELHDIIREFFYSRLTPKKRIDYHTQAAQYYNEQNDELAFVEAAYHLIQSNDQDGAAKLVIKHASTMVDKGFHEEIMNVLMGFGHDVKTEYISKLNKIKGQILDLWGEWDNTFEYYYQCLNLNNYLNNVVDFEIDRKRLHYTVGYISWTPHEVETALTNLKSSLKVVQDVNDKVGINEIHCSLGWVSWLKGDYKNAINYYNRSLAELKSLPVDVLEKRANILINLGNIYWEQQEWKIALEKFSESINIFKEMKNHYKVARLYNNIGCVYLETNELDKAINFFNKGIKLSEEIYYIRGKGYTLLHLGECYLRQNKLLDAKKTFENAQDILTRIEDNHGMIYSKINIGLIHSFQQEWGKAKDYFLSAVESLNDLDFTFYLGEVYLELSSIFSNLNKQDLANEFRKNANNTFKNIQKMG